MPGMIGQGESSGDSDILVDIKAITASVMMAPDEQYTLVPPEHRTPGSEEDRWFLMEKPGLKLAQLTGYEDDMDIDEATTASLGQTDIGLHMRQRARVWTIGETATTANRVVFVNAIAMGDTGVRRAILAGLATKYGTLYNVQNIAISSTHQHSGVGGYLENLLPQITSLGWVEQTYDAIVTGVLLAMDRAHDSLTPGTLSIGNTSVVGGNINRSPTAYLANPAAERAMYVNEGSDQDKAMSLLSFGEPGFLSWFPVHGTSLYEVGVQSDSVNLHGLNFRRPHRNGMSATPLPTPSVPSASPRASPMTKEMIAQIQVDAAKSLMSQTLAPITCTVRSVHVYLDMATHNFTLPNGTLVNTCPAAMGFSFAGGTTDGPGSFDFVQGDNSTSQNPLWEIVKSFITPIPSAAQTACQFRALLGICSGRYTGLLRN
ncbi:Neutral/alkaline non-lysosomal ceramidase-domain-containing protein [Mycena galopus ATCC 62051]|nr:Neutral/alkaline non-lysosomal ceramidase-domain-containing protein [Mycena galopus ATCC 62051]